MNSYWQSDDELFDLARRELFTAVVGDAMDRLGLLHQFLPPEIRPLELNMVVIGRAMPVLTADTYEMVSSGEAGGSMSRPFGLMLDALDDLQPHEVYFCSGGSGEYALWGELMSIRAIRLGAAGVVLNGYLRDSAGILSLQFPAFAFGSFAQDQGPRGKVVDYRCAVTVGMTTIRSGDILFGDRDGVCVVPREAEEEVIVGALEKARGEKTVQRAIEEGMSARAAFEKYGIL